MLETAAVQKRKEEKMRSKMRESIIIIIIIIIKLTTYRQGQKQSASPASRWRSTPVPP